MLRSKESLLLMVRQKNPNKWLTISFSISEILWTKLVSCVMQTCKVLDSVSYTLRSHIIEPRRKWISDHEFIYVPINNNCDYFLENTLKHQDCDFFSRKSAKTSWLHELHMTEEVNHLFLVAWPKITEILRPVASAVIAFKWTDYTLIFPFNFS